jgi:hypothetical protein
MTGTGSAAATASDHAGGVIPPEPLTSGQPDVKGGAMTTPASLEQQHTFATAVARYDELRMRDLLTPGPDDPPADEQPGPGQHPHGVVPARCVGMQLHIVAAVTCRLWRGTRVVVDPVARTVSLASR